MRLIATYYGWCVVAGEIGRMNIQGKEIDRLAVLTYPRPFEAQGKAWYLQGSVSEEIVLLVVSAEPPLSSHEPSA